MLFAHKHLYITNTIRLLYETMKIQRMRFNTYLLLLLCCAAAGGGCKTGGTAEKPGGDANTKHKSNESSVLRLHLEVNADGTDRNIPVQISRQSPFTVNVERQHFLAEIHIGRADLVDDGLGGFVIQIQFNRQGTWLLEQYTTAHKGSRIAVLCEFGEIRWLGAPRITQRISDGVFAFTPDATREEAEIIVHGLRNAIRKERGKNTIKEPVPK